MMSLAGRKVCLAVTLCSLAFVLGFFFGQSRNLEVKQAIQLKVSYQTDQTIAALRHLAKGHRYIRSGKALVEVNEAYRILFATIGQGYQQNLTLAREETKSQVSGDVCPEIWMGNKHGYPYYFTGFVIENCTWAPPFSSVITILLDCIYNSNLTDLPQLIQGINTTYHQMDIKVAVKSSDKSAATTLCEQYPNCQVVEINSAIDEGAVWLKLISAVTTKYALVGRKLSQFLPDARLERLVRLLSYTNASVVGGAFRNSDGHLSLGCYQVAMRNYAYRLVDGYDLSYNSCIYCDYLGGPFAVRPDLATKYLRSSLAGDILFADFFQQIHSASEEARVLSCPDSLFFTDNLNISTTTRAEWQPFARLWELNKVMLPSGEVFLYNCAESGLKCSWLKGIAMPLCCLQELSDSLKTLMEICDREQIGCELEGGSVVGGLKFNGQLPWERDADVNWDSHNFALLEKHKEAFKAKGYRLIEDSGKTVISRDCVAPPNYNNSDVNCGYYAFRSANFRIELWGVKYLSNYYLELKGVKTPTRSLLDGMWMQTYPNPALNARNLYGDDVFEHVEHWITLGFSTGWIPYKTGSFMKCPRPNFHGCLDQFLPVGNLQFLDLYV